MIVSIDLSLRSTGVVALDDDKNLIDFYLVQSSNKPNKKLETYNDEPLLIYNTNSIVDFIERNSYHGIDAILIEGLSFGSLSSTKDILAGNYWNLRVRLHQLYQNVPIVIIPVQSWRNKILDKQDRKDAKKKHGKKWAKMGVVDKLPKGAKLLFELFIMKHKLKLTSIYDLADAYSMGVYYIDHAS